jgi:curved DNA-binding protein CbpA/ribosomal protein S27AE
LYELFDVPEDATIAVIKKSYKRLAIKYHPDKLVDVDDDEFKAKAEHELIRINNAKDILLNVKKKAEYDSLLAELRVNIDDPSEDFYIDINYFDNLDEPDLDIESEVEWDATSFSSTDEAEPEVEIEESEYDENVNPYINEPISDSINESDNSNNAEKTSDYDPRDRYQASIQDSSVPKTQPQPQPVQPPAQDPRPDPVFSTIQRRFLTFCPKCGEENLTGGPVCIVCHTSLDTSLDQPIPVGPRQDQYGQAAQPTETYRITCPRCGFESPMGSPFCRNCNLEFFYGPPDQSRSIRWPNKDQEQNIESIQESDETIGRIACPRCHAMNIATQDNCKICNANLATSKANLNSSAIDKDQGVSTSSTKPQEGLAVIVCPRCKAQNLNGTKFCVGCNLNLIPYTGPPRNNMPYDPSQRYKTQYYQPQKIECPHCGSITSVDSDCCESCFKNIIHDQYFQPRSFDKPETAPEVEIIDRWPKRCPRCGYGIVPGERGCRYCGLMFS